MANKKLTEKTSLSTLADGDLFHVVDVSDNTGSAEGTSKKGLFSLVKSTLKTYFDSLYNLITSTKNAKDYGFLPTNNGEDNAIALQAAVDGGGEIIIDLIGTYDLNASIVIPSDTNITFGKGVYIRKVLYNGSSPRHTFVNAGAFTKTYNSNISLRGLNLICNGIGIGEDSTTSVTGLNGHIAFFYVKNLEIRDYICLDIDVGGFGVQVCTFEDLKIYNCHLEGDKDTIHLGKGKRFVIKHVITNSGDDGIALNGHDWVTSNPQVGWIEDGLIEDVYDLNNTTGTGFFSRMLAGAWVDWFTTMDIHRGDTIVASNNKMYRSTNVVGSTIYTSITEPTHASGTVTIDGIDWLMIQDDDITYTAGVKNVTFRNIFLEKDRPTAFSFQFSDSDFSRSYYPNAANPIQGGIVFQNVLPSGTLTNIITSKTPVSDFKYINGCINDENMFFEDMGIAGLVYPETDILISNNTFNGTGTPLMISSQINLNLKILGSNITNDSFIPTFSSTVNIINSDLHDQILKVVRKPTGYTWTPNTRTSAIFENTHGAGNIVSIVGQNTGQCAVWFGDEDSQTVGRISYDHSNNKISLWAGGVERFSISGADIGIGTDSPLARLHVRKGDTGLLYTPSAITNGIFEGTTSNSSQISIIGKAAGYSAVWFGDEDVENRGRVQYDHTTDWMHFYTASGLKVTITGGGKMTTVGAIKASGGYESSDGSTGATGSFTAQSGEVVTVKDGLITSIV